MWTVTNLQHSNWRYCIVLLNISTCHGFKLYNIVINHFKKLKCKKNQPDWYENVKFIPIKLFIDPFKTTVLRTVLRERWYCRWNSNPAHLPYLNWINRSLPKRGSVRVNQFYLSGFCPKKVSIFFASFWSAPGAYDGS